VSQHNGWYLSNGASNTLITRYNAIYNCIHHCFDAGGNTGQTQIYDSAYNYIEGAGSGTGHGNSYICETDSCTYYSRFDTIMAGLTLSPNGCSTSGSLGDCWDSPAVFTSDSGGTANVNGFYSYNTIMTRNSGITDSLLKIEGAHNSPGVVLQTLQTSHNYFDQDGASGTFFYSANQFVTVTGPFTCTGNVKINDNTAITGNFGITGYTCN
jgi:hypothetical protein